MAGEALTPSALWAQRSSTIYLTICLEDCPKPEIQIKSDSLLFSGIGGADKKLNKLNINFYGEIDPEKSMQSVKDRNIEFVLRKTKDGYWPQLTKEKVKNHWLKVDFNKWKDEDESDDEEGGPENDDFESMMKKMGSLQGAGDGEKPNLDDLNMDSEDSDDNNELPELE